MAHVNRLPLEAHGVDFSRVRMWSLNNWSRYFRQTLVFGALEDPQINSLFSKFCVNIEGQVGIHVHLYLFPAPLVSSCSLISPFHHRWQ